jgi:DNA-binding IclR family transcriptional regulator
MPVAQTSISNYHQLRGEGVTSRLQQIILRELRRNRKGLTRAEIAEKTGIDKSSVAGRCNELMDTYLYEKGTRTCTVTGKTVHVVVAV